MHQQFNIFGTTGGAHGIGKVHNLETWFQAIEINGNMANGVARVDSRPCTPRKG